MTEPQSTISLLQIATLMGGLLLLSLVLLGIALVMTRRRKSTPRKAAPEKPAQQTPAREKRKPAERSPSPRQQDEQPPRRRARPAADPAASPADAAPRLPQPAQAVSPAVNPPPPQSAEVLRVYQDERDNSLILEVDGTRYRTLGDIRQAGIEKPFLATLRELARIAKETGNLVTQDAPDPAAAPPPNRSAPLPNRSAPLPDRSTPPPDRSAPLPSMDELTGSPPNPQEAAPIGTFFDNMRRMIPGGPSPAELEQPMGIADEIEAILQLKLLSSDEFRGRGLHIRSAPGGGVQIEVGTRVYETVGDIEDEDIRAFVQSAIQDWERQQG